MAVTKKITMRRITMLLKGEVNGCMIKFQNIDPFIDKLKSIDDGTFWF